jgi:V8-like Glu-specific endopeptidase
MTFHACTASVIRSPGHNIIMTAAHCLAEGNGKGYLFAPGYNNGKRPYGTWTTTAAYASRSWVKHDGDQRQDFVFFTVAPRNIHGTMTNIQDVVGGNNLGLRPKRGESVRITGYPLGIGGQAITCQTTVAFVAGFPTTHCYGFADGTSGGPWLAGSGKTRTVVGTISGLHQGGCSKAVANSTQLGAPAQAVLRRAEQGQGAVSMPARPGDGCKNGF